MSGRAVLAVALGSRHPGLTLSLSVRALAATLSSPGEVSEWPKERDCKSRTCRKVGRGFESLPLRFPERPRAGGPCGAALSHRHTGAQSRVREPELLPVAYGRL